MICWPLFIFEFYILFSVASNICFNLCIRFGIIITARARANTKRNTHLSAHTQAYASSPNKAIIKIKLVFSVFFEFVSFGSYLFCSDLALPIKFQPKHGIRYLHLFNIIINGKQNFKKKSKKKTKHVCLYIHQCGQLVELDEIL